MDSGACTVKIVTPKLRTICAIAVEPKDTVLDVKTKVEVIFR